MTFEGSSLFNLLEIILWEMTEGKFSVFLKWASLKCIKARMNDIRAIIIDQYSSGNKERQPIK